MRQDLSPRLQVVIIADDMTGALDAAGPFACRGLKTLFVSDVSHVPDAMQQAPDVLAVNTSSRKVSPEEATRRVAAFMQVLPKPVYLFNKVDSRLKGNIEAELLSIPFERALVAPAIPKFKRTVEKGRITGFGIDTPISIAQKLGAFVRRVELPDTATDGDIRLALTQANDCDLLIGARGLAEALAQRISGIDAPEETPVSGTSMLIAAGSRDPITLVQLTALRRHVAQLIDIEAPNGCADLASSPMDKERLLLVQATPGSKIQSGPDVEQQLAKTICTPNISDRDVLVLTGGATAEAILQQLGLSILSVTGEALPGLPVSRSGNLTIVTKSGGFGAPDTLIRIFEQISCPQ